MKIKLIGKGKYQIIYNSKVIGNFDKYDIKRLNNAQVGAILTLCN